MLSAAGLTKSYKRATALRGVDLEVAAGEVVGLLGPNGAGKSTLTKVLCGLVKADGGSATIAGSKAGSFRARANVGYLAELFRFPGWATADEVLITHQRLAHRPADPAEREALLTEVGLAHAAGTRVETMSKGMQQRLGLAQAMIGAPPVLLLDEPTSALDPAGRHTVREVLARARDRGTAVLLNTHLLGEVELLADRVVLIDAGKVVAEGTVADLTAAHGVTVETDKGRSEHPDLARDDIAALVAKLVKAGRKIYAVEPHRSTLEDLYLRLVGDRESQR
ncbi:MAG TPA: ABC transporter ATP-binding protein [Mycobacteriales bacterium]|nr:ABC transporter ATP-binding protein [Mycobacteriales bacterium]